MTKTYLKKHWLLVTVFLIGLIYILIPGPSSIDNFPPLPNSTKSKLEGDTIQNPNIAAYFSQFDRAYITEFYRKHFEKSLIPGLPIPAIRLNHPPEEAYQYVRDQQESTFLEEYVRPFRESIFVNGYEPITDNILRNAIRSFEGDHIRYEDNLYVSKTTLRYYPSNIFMRIILYLGVWVLGIYLYKLYMRVFKEGV